MPSGFIPAHGGYNKLFSYQKSQVVYDATVRFCERHFDKYDRTVGQMVQAARSGKQNIAEGSVASGTSKKTELKLVGVARASLEELLLDYQDFLRQRQLPVWGKDHPQAQAIRKLAYVQNRSYATYRTYVEDSPPETAANTLICLIHQANYLLDRQLRGLEGQFIREGGYSERLRAARLEARAIQRGGGKSDRPDQSDRTNQVPAPPVCPVCSGVMVLRTVRKGAKVGSRFWGCSRYPHCTGSRPVEDSAS